MRDTAAGAGQRDLIQGEIDYFEANRQRMNYRQYREQHSPIASDTVESPYKNVAAARMKQSGTIWTSAEAQHMPHEPAIHSLGSHPGVFGASVSYTCCTFYGRLPTVHHLGRDTVRAGRHRCAD